MKRTKKHKVKREKPETSTSYIREQEEHDLAYYIHDRVELMHQVFSVLKYKELKAMAPECIRNISVGDLQELCTEELLGISSKRLCAILDGAEPPSDTESSSRSPSPEMETISLDSISSDEEILSQDSIKKNKKHKHKRRDSKTRTKSKKKSKEQPQEETEVSKASRAGLTVLELLELQARARAIRAQLQQDQAAKRASETAMAEFTTSHHSSDNEVVIKEEPQEVVEISSEDEKPSIQELEKLDTALNPPSTSTTQPMTKETDTNSQPLAKHISNLIITVPQTKPSKKIKLNRNKVLVSMPNIPAGNDGVTSSETRNIIIASEKKNTVENTEKVVKPLVTSTFLDVKSKEKSKKRLKKSKKNVTEKDGSDHDEITLQLSDSEKMDLLEDLDRKTYEYVSSSADSENSSTDSGEECSTDTINRQETKDVPNTKSIENTETKEVNIENSNVATTRQIMGENNDKSTKDIDDSSLNPQNEHENSKIQEEIKIIMNEIDTTSNEPIVREGSEVMIKEGVLSVDDVITPSVIEIASINDIPISGDFQNMTEKTVEMNKDSNMQKASIENDSSDKNAVHCEVNEKVENEATGNKAVESERELSEGELSDRESSEVETLDTKLEVVCISDEEASKNQKKKKKKDKKSKKEKKRDKKSKSDFRESADQNFYEDSTEINVNDSQSVTTDIGKTADSIDIDDVDVYEILELSDDSSCYEVEGTVLSKEPTTEEIEALSAKIDEIEREEVISEEQIQQYESLEAEKEENVTNIESVSWKDRYLSSKKVKKVLTTSNIFNALRKKNKELKNKLRYSKREEEIAIDKEPEKSPKKKNVELGSIEHYNTLQGLTNFVDPVLAPIEEDAEKDNGDPEKNAKELIKDRNVTTEMKKDAKQLLKMYRKLLKYNDMNKQKDPNKKKKKKMKKMKEKSQNSGILGVATGEV